MLTGFLTDGHFERHLNRMRAIYRSRHDCLLEALEPLRRDFRIYGENAGVHLLLQDLHGRSEEELCRLAAAGGVWVHGISEYRLKQEEKEKNTENMPPQIYDGAVLLGFAGLMEGQLRSGAEALVRAWMFTKN